MIVTEVIQRRGKTMADESYTKPPKAGDQLELSLGLECTMGPAGTGGGTMTLVHELCTARITKEGKALGEVCGMIGGGIQLHDERDGSVWHLTALDIFRAYDKARAFQVFERARAAIQGGEPNEQAQQGKARNAARRVRAGR
jgi:hypothetical protein